ncbi:hypothetical protein QAD02_003886 [Eretmocerus hayati]|uniref:Uncharacterized protein n=1 Tax=Eretmocerus hayati TaxID=131215 RepID=A0ACC2NQT8_9HYME|nr:hypothetical protein QAD02_003886 [Eretmocerus hayati]
MSSSSRSSSYDGDSSRDYDFFGKNASFWESFNPDEVMKANKEKKDSSICDEIYEEDNNFEYPEVLAVSKANDIDEMKRLIDEGFDINVCNTFILFHAISWSRFEMVNFSLDAGAKRDCAMNIPKIGPLNQAIRLKCIPKQ